jgi:hypothetical protein
MSVKLCLDPRASLDDTEGPMTSGKGVYAGDVAWTSSSPRNEPGDARVHNRIEPDSRTDPLTNFLDDVIGKNRDIKIFLDVVDACSCGERSRDALYGLARPRS